MAKTELTTEQHRVITLFTTRHNNTVISIVKETGYTTSFVNKTIKLLFKDKNKNNENKNKS